MQGLGIFHLLTMRKTAVVLHGVVLVPLQLEGVKADIHTAQLLFNLHPPQVPQHMSLNLKKISAEV